MVSITRWPMVDLNEEGDLWGIYLAHVDQDSAAVSLRWHLNWLGVTDDYEPFWDDDVTISHVRGEFVEHEHGDGEWVPSEDGEAWTFVSLGATR